MNCCSLSGWLSFSGGVFVLLVLLVLSGCQANVYLMPTPVGLQADTRLYDLGNTQRDDNRITTLYATNRVANSLKDSRTGYTIFPSDDLQFGVATHKVGEEIDSWEELFTRSLQRERDDRLLISLERADEHYRLREKEPIDPLSTRGKLFFSRVNQAIAESADKDLTVYVHGANSNFYRATAQGAQYFHFTGHNSIVLTFSWPSAENIFRYKVDVLHASKTVPAFARLIEILAAHSTAKNINIISYSAGAQVTAPALVQLRNKYLDQPAEVLRERFRLGEVYFAAPDIELSSFAYRLQTFKNIVQRITISSNIQDSVLRYAALSTGKSRAGRPSASDLSEQETQLFITASRDENLDLLDIHRSHALNAGGSHDFWYNHPWVSNDVLMIMLFNLPPGKRGLQRVITETGLETWIFPENYDEKISELLQEFRAAQPD